MSILRREPRENVLSLREAMNRLIEDSLIRPEPGLVPWERALVPEVDMYETPEAIEIEASIPGIKPEDLEISVTGDVLTLHGEVKEEKESRKGRQVVQERRYGSFTRSISLPTHVNVDQARAEFENGVLKLHLPKVEGAKPRAIQIKKQ